MSDVDEAREAILKFVSENPGAATDMLIAREKRITELTHKPTHCSARALAEEALRALGEEDLLFSHHGVVMARPKAYERLADFIRSYNDGLQTIDVVAEDADELTCIHGIFHRAPCDKCDALASIQDECRCILPEEGGPPIVTFFCPIHGDAKR